MLYFATYVLILYLVSFIYKTAELNPNANNADFHIMEPGLPEISDCSARNSIDAQERNTSL
jgi:hypothetical protein